MAETIADEAVKEVACDELSRGSKNWFVPFYYWQKFPAKRAQEEIIATVIGNMRAEIDALWKEIERQGQEGRRQEADEIVASRD